jgi:hypothetical protein
MSMENQKIRNTLKMRENANIDQRARKDAPVFWAVLIMCLLAFAYLAVTDERFQPRPDVPVMKTRMVK